MCMHDLIFERYLGEFQGLTTIQNQSPKIRITTCCNLRDYTRKLLVGHMHSIIYRVQYIVIYKHVYIKGDREEK
jgi:hypothetical protein